MITAAAMPVLAALPAAASMAGFAQAGLGLRAARAFRKTPRTKTSTCPGVTVLKPLHGDEILLTEALTSFCQLDWPNLQILCGVASPHDRAIAVVERLQAAYPHVRLDLVVNATVHGHNRKVSNLINMLPFAAHDVLVMSDSDMHVAPDYLRHVTATLGQPGTGLVTSYYVGRRPRAGLIANLASAHIAQIFVPGALLARALGRQDCLGATMALTRQTLDAAGGLNTLLPFVADDAVLGRAVTALGLAVRVAPTIPATTLAETTPAALWHHELRWARTVRSVEPLGFAASILQFPLVFAALTAILLGPTPAAFTLLALCFALRAGLGRAIEIALTAPKTPLWLSPLREALSVVVWVAAHTGNRVAWRGEILATISPHHATPPDISLANATAEGPRR